MALLGAVVVRVDLQPKSDLFEDRVRLILPRLTVLDRGLVLELPEVHELADRRSGLGRDLDEVEIGLLGETQRVFNPDDADLLPVGADQPHLRDADTVVNPGLADVVLLHAVTKTTGTWEKAPERGRAEASVRWHGTKYYCRAPPSKNHGWSSSYP
jgi:hypothetical protein